MPPDIIESAGIVGINGTYMDEGTLSGIQGQIQRSIHGRYYRKHLLDVMHWRRFLMGKSDLRKIVRFLTGASGRWLGRTPPALVPEGAAQQWEMLARRSVDSFLIYSEGSTAWDVFCRALKPCLGTGGRTRVAVEIIKDCDHVFTLLWSQAVLIDRIRAWMLSEERDWGSIKPPMPTAHRGAETREG